MNLKKSLVILGIIGSSLVGVGYYLYKNDNPSYYSISSEPADALQRKESRKGTIPGEQSYKIWLKQSTADEIRQDFVAAYFARNGSKPETGTVKEQDLIDFSVEYVGKKLHFRHTVLFPGRIVRSLREVLPFAETVLPPKTNEYFQNTKSIDLAGKNEVLTDCWDYAELFSRAFNLLAKDYALAAEAHRVRGLTHFAPVPSLDVIMGDHDFNVVLEEDGTKRYIDPTGPDTAWISNRPDISDKVVVVAE